MGAACTVKPWNLIRLACTAEGPRGRTRERIAAKAVRKKIVSAAAVIDYINQWVARHPDAQGLAGKAIVPFESGWLQQLREPHPDTGANWAPGNRIPRRMAHLELLIKVATHEAQKLFLIDWGE